MDTSKELASEQIGSTTTQEEIEPFLEETIELVQQRRSQGRIIWDRFIRNRAAVVGAVALLVLVLFCFIGPYLWTINPHATNALSVSSTLANPTLTLFRGSTERTVAPATPTQSPTPTSTPSYTSFPGSRARTLPCAVATSSAPR